MGDEVKWHDGMMLEVEFDTPSKFFIIKETLTRIGIISFKNKTIIQSCHILHKQGRYFIMHFKELYALDGKNLLIPVEDIKRRNSIALLLEKWGILKVVGKINDNDVLPENEIKYISYNKKKNWKLKVKYLIKGKIR